MTLPVAFNFSAYTPPKWLEDINGIYPNTQFSLQTNYFLGLLIVPGILLGISIICIMSYQIAICCRCCVTCCCPTRCKYCFVQKKDFIKGDFKTRARYYKYTLVAFGIWWSVALIFTCFMIWPYQNLSQGFTSTSDSIGFIAVIFNSILALGKLVEKGVTTLSNSIVQEPCASAFEQTGGSTVNLTNRTASLTIIIESLLARIGNIPALLNEASDTVTYTVNPIIKTIFWWYFGIMILTLFLWLLIFVIRSKKYLTFMIIATEIIVLILTIIYSVELFVAHLNSSYCYPNPTLNTLNQFSVDNPMFATLTHFTTCGGKMSCNL